jgi:hypothetical protein
VDERRFDTIVQGLAAPAPRRAAMRGLGGVLALLAALGVTGAAAAERRNGGNKKKGGDGNKNKNDKSIRKKERQRRKSSSKSNSSGGPGPSAPTGPSGPDNATSEEVAAEAKRGKTGKPGATGPTGPTGPGGGAAGPLDNLTDVVIASPTDGQVLVFNDETDRWENLNAARLLQLFLTGQALQVFRNDAASLSERLDLSLADLDTNATRTQRFPDGDGVFVLDSLAQTLTNKTITVDDDKFTIQDGAAPTAKARFRADNIALGDTLEFSFPSVPGILTVGNNTQTLQNKSVVDSNFTIQDSTDPNPANLKRARFSTSPITVGQTRTFTLPDASGVVALQNAFTVAEVVGGDVSIGGTGSATADCSSIANSRAVGVGINANGPAQVRAMRITSATAVSVTVETAVNTTVNAVAFCMRMP